MPSEPPPSEPVGKQGSRFEPDADPPPRGGAYSALDELSAASNRFAHTGPARHPGRNGFHPILTIIAAITVGCFLTLAGPCEYICGATFRVSGEDGDAQLTSFRTSLLDYCWQQMSNSSNEAPAVDWFVESSGTDLLRLCIETTDRQAGVERLGQVAQGYLAMTSAEMQEERSTPTEGEVILSEFAAELQARLDATQAVLEESLTSLPSTDPTGERKVLLDRWQVLRRGFLDKREQLVQATATLTRLESEPEPTHGIVSGEDRNEALKVDEALQQDLRELEVNLTELKVHLLNVWKESAADLEQLVRATQGLLEMTQGESDTWNAPAEQATRSEAARATEQYQVLLGEFTEIWRGEFAALRQLKIDPLSGEVVAIHQRLRAALGDFLFTASKHLASLRAGVLSLGSSSEDHARLHVLESNLMRSFQAVQTPHRRFEFSASGVEPRDNFRIDTALKSARGLRRRSQHQIQEIDRRLERDAAQRAREEHAAALEEARKKVEELRSLAGGVVEELVTLQDELNLSVGLTEDFLRNSLVADLVEDQVHTTQSDLARAEDRLQSLATRRAEALNSVNIELVDCGVIDGPINLGKRLSLGGFGALVTALIVGLGQWWLGRRG